MFTITYMRLISKLLVNGVSNLFSGIRKIHGHTDTRTLYTDLLFSINFWKLEKYTDPLEKYTDPLTHGFNTQNLENQLVQN